MIKFADVYLTGGGVKYGNVVYGEGENGLVSIIMGNNELKIGGKVVMIFDETHIE